MADRNPSRARLAPAIAALCLALTACGKQGALERAPQPGDVAVAKVDGHSIWASDVKREAVAQGLIGQGEPLDVSSDTFRQVLDEVIDQKLLSAEAVRRKLDKDPAAQKRLAAARERVLSDLLVESVVEKAVSEDSIRKLYAEQVKLSKQSEELRARQIVAPNQQDAAAIRKALAGGGSFEALAMQRSTDAATRFSGGDMGYFTLDVMPEAYQTALKDAKAGEVVGPFQTDAGWAIVRIEDRRPEAPITLDAARPQIVRFLTYDQVRDMIEKLRGKSKVQVLLKAPPEVPGAPREPASAPAPARGGQS